MRYKSYEKLSKTHIETIRAFNKDIVKDIKISMINRMLKEMDEATLDNLFKITEEVTTDEFAETITFKSEISVS